MYIINDQHSHMLQHPPLPPAHHKPIFAMLACVNCTFQGALCQTMLRRNVIGPLLDCCAVYSVTPPCSAVVSCSLALP